MIMILIISIIMLRFKIVIHKKSCWKIGQNSNDYSQLRIQTADISKLSQLSITNSWIRKVPPKDLFINQGRLGMWMGI